MFDIAMPRMSVLAQRNGENYHAEIPENLHWLDNLYAELELKFDSRFYNLLLVRGGRKIVEDVAEVKIKAGLFHIYDEPHGWVGIVEAEQISAHGEFIRTIPKARFRLW